MTYIFLGEIKIVEELFKKIEKLVKSRVMQEDEIYTLYIIKALLFEMQGHYKEALECVDKVIEIFIKDGHHINDSYAFTIYMYRADMLNFLGRYQEAYNQVQSLYNSIHNEYEDGGIYVIMARSALGLGKVDQAYEYISNSILMFLAEDKKNAENTNYSKNRYLADAYVVQGDILLAQGNIKGSIESYKKAYAIYHYFYGDKSKNIAQVSDLYNKGANVACKNKDLYNYKFFGKPQIKEFGIHHPNTVDMFEYCKQYDMDLWVKNH